MHTYPDMSCDGLTSEEYFREVIQNDFFDPEFLDEELPDEFFADLAPRFATNELVNVAKRPMMINDTVTSVMHHFNYDKDQIEVGPRELGKTIYDIDYDYHVVEPVIQWYCNYLDGAVVDFPYLEVANPYIPLSKQKDVPEYSIQKFFMVHGFILAEPSYSEVTYLATAGSFLAKAPFSHLVEAANDQTRGQRVFRAFSDVEDTYLDYNYVAMQFNPYHPFAIRMIRTIRFKKYGCKGYYEYNGKRIPFKYSLLDTRFRMHSDVWASMVGSVPDRHLVFDFVSNFDFLEFMEKRFFGTGREIGDLMYLRGTTFYNTTNVMLVEPIWTNRVAKDGYSVIGPWVGSIGFGVRGNVYVPYITKVARVNEEFNYIDVSDLVRKKEDDMYSVRCFCNKCVVGKNYDSPMCDCEKVFYSRRKMNNRQNRPKYKDINKNNEKFYFGLSRVFYPMSNGTYNFATIDVVIDGFPTNGKVSLIYEPHYTRLSTLFFTPELKKSLIEMAALSVDVINLVANVDGRSVPDPVEEEDIVASEFDELFNQSSGKFIPVQDDEYTEIRLIDPTVEQSVEIAYFIDQYKCAIIEDDLAYIRKSQFLIFLAFLNKIRCGYET